MTKILALIDGSIYSRSVCDNAAWIASKTGAAIEILHVLGRRETTSIPHDLSGSLDADVRSTLLTELTALDEQRAKLAQQRGRIILDQAKNWLAEEGVAEVTTKLRNGDLVETVQQFETDVDMIVIGKRGEGADFAKLHLGSNLERIVRSSKKPVLVAARAFRPISKALVAFDGGQSSAKAISYMAQSKIFDDVSISLLQVGTPTDAMRSSMEHAAISISRRGDPVHTNFVAGQPEELIAKAVEADQIDLLVMGAYGHSRIRNFIIGSTTAEMIRSCKIPILLFR
ncbi:universal stress protein [Phyllobacterium sp. K27]